MSKVICIHEYKLKRDNPSLFGELYDNRSEEDLNRLINKGASHLVVNHPRVFDNRPYLQHVLGPLVFRYRNVEVYELQASIIE